MKSILTLGSLLMAFACPAQTKSPLHSSTSSIKLVIEKVARDYYQDFNNIKGDTLSQNDHTIQFKSTLAPQGALSTSLTKYLDPYSYSWQATMFQSEDYEAAASKYKEYYRQLQGTTLTFYDKTSYKLGGYYDTPDENRGFASSILELQGTHQELSLFKVEVALNYSLPTWTVQIMVYEKVRDSEIRPSAK